RRRPLRARAAGGPAHTRTWYVRMSGAEHRQQPDRRTRYVLSNAWIVTCDDARTEHERGWLRIGAGLVAEIGAGDPPGPGEDLHGAVFTPGLVNTHHHLYQTLTR